MIIKAKVIGLLWKQDEVKCQFHAELHWLDVADRVTYKLGWMVYMCLHG